MIELPENLQPKKQKSEIQIPSWRQVSLRGLNGIRPEDLEEDLSDEAFERRHRKAEEEEQMLWEKWTEMREAEGKEEGGRVATRGNKSVASTHQSPHTSRPTERSDNQKGKKR